MAVKNWKFNITDNGTFVWQAASKNGEIIGQSSQNFKSRNGARYNADLLGRSGKFSQKLVWDFMQNASGDWSWKADNSVNKENVAASHKLFQSRLEAMKNATLFGYNGELIDDGKNTKAAIFNVETPSTKINQSESAIDHSATSKKNIYMDNRAGFNSLWWLKWLFLALLILALLFWLLPLLMRRLNSQPSTENKPTPSISVNQSAGLIGSLQKLNFDILEINLEKSKLIDTIDKSTPLTMLAPTNAAFQSLPPETLVNLEKPENIEQLQGLLRNHLFSGNIDLSSLKGGSTIKSLAGADLTVKIVDGKLFIGGVEVDKTIDESSNGFAVYAINKLLTVSDIKANIVPDPATPPTISKSDITADIPVVETKKEPMYKNGGNLDILNKDGGFTMLLVAINASDLKDSLETDSPITLFAPTDDAMKSIQSTVDDLLKLENKPKLQTFLKDHIVLNKITFQHFVNSTVVTNINNRPIILNTNTKGGYAQAISAKSASLAPIDDIFTNNGVLQVLTSSPLLN